METLMYNINEDAVRKFWNKYPVAVESMVPYLKLGFTGLQKSYCQWLEGTEALRDSLECGAGSETVESPCFGTKTFYKYEWDGCRGWAEVFEYLYKNINLHEDLEITQRRVI